MWPKTSNLIPLSYILYYEIIRCIGNCYCLIPKSHIHLSCMKITFATKCLDIAHTKVNCWKALRQVLLDVLTHCAIDLPLKEKNWFSIPILGLL
jgi:hypothetical protein